MAQRTWQGGATAVAQVDTFSITGAGGGAETWTWTITGEDGTTKTLTFVDDGTPTTQEIVTGLVAAWNDSTHPFALAVTAADAGDPDITLTADTAGVPFYVTLAASGTGTASKASTTVNQGPNDYATEANWVEGSVPVANDDVRITGSQSITYGLDQGSVELDDFIVENYTGEIGSAGAKLQIDMADADRFEFDSTGQAYINVGSAAITAVVQRTKSQSGRQAGLHLTGTAIATLRVEGGSVLLDGSTVTTVVVESGAKAVIPGGNTVTTVNTGGSGSVLEVAATTVNVVGGTLETNGSGAITTLNVDDGTVTANSTGTITTLNADGGTTDFTKQSIARTVTTVNARGGKVKYDPNVLTITNAIAGPGPLEVRAA